MIRAGIGMSKLTVLPFRGRPRRRIDGPALLREWLRDGPRLLATETIDSSTTF
jgi:hypothetical protein